MTLKFRKMTLSGGDVVWDLEVPLVIQLPDEALQNLDTAYDGIVDELDMAFLDVRQRIMKALEESSATSTPIPTNSSKDKN